MNLSGDNMEEIFTTTRGTKIIVHRSDLTEEERAKRMKEIEESATRLLRRGK